MQYVIKRNGRKERFNATRIFGAILKAMNQVGHRNDIVAYSITKSIQSDLEYTNTTPTVEQIQDLVEHYLMDSDYKDVAKAYILYRDVKAQVRKQREKTDKVIEEKLLAKNIQNQNANVDELSFGGRKGEACSEMMRNYALEHLISQQSKQNHLENMVYIHDLDAYAVGEHNCLTIPFDDLLANGFNTRQTDVRPANSVNTAFQLLAVIFQLQSLQQFGGVSASHLDWTMVPYVRKSFIKHYNDGLKYIENMSQMSKETCKRLLDTPINHTHYTQNQKAWQYAMDKTQDEVNQAVEGMLHNLNTLQSRSGNQLNGWLAMR